ncbi:MAG: ABC transporter permease subunit [Planctomycetes bacterium]|nr:ABC transporter permease subunit [Planctomycetota bacterium]
MPRLRTLDRISAPAKAVTYAFLVLVGVTMVLPFLWMVATALKPTSQVDKLSWVPYREYFTLNGRQVEIQGAKLPVAPGRYRVLIRGDGPRGGQRVEVSSNQLTAFADREDRFAWQDAQTGQTYDVSIDAILEPQVYEVGYMATDVAAADVLDWDALWRRIAEARDAERPGPDGKPTVWTAFDAPPADEKAQAHVLAALNAVLARRDLYETGPWEATPLFLEAKRLKDMGLTKIPEAQVRGFNRYVLAAAWPEALSRARTEVRETDILRRVSPRWENFPRCITRSEVFGRAFINSIVIAAIVTAGQLLTCSLAAFAFARLEFRGRDVLFLGYMATLMIPGAVTMVPLFVILKAIPDLLNAAFATDFFSASLYFIYAAGGAAARTMREFYLGKVVGLDSYFAMIVPGLFSAYGTFMLRQFFLSLPRDLEDAAFIDGCSLLGVWRNVALPLSLPALATLGIFTFMGSWRSFLWPLVVTSTPDMQPVFVMLSSFQGVTATEWNLMMAGTLMVVAPMIAVFLFGQRFFIEGIQLGGVKE